MPTKIWIFDDQRDLLWSGLLKSFIRAEVADFGLALPADWKRLRFIHGDVMRQSMLVVYDFVDTGSSAELAGK